jgi:hypothetical protein
MKVAAVPLGLTYGTRAHLTKKGALRGTHISFTGRNN